MTLTAFTNLRETFWTLTERAPSRLLIYLEWVLLFATLMQQALPVPFVRLPRILPISLLLTLLFGIIGLKLPKKSLEAKIAYTLLEFILIYLPIAFQIHFPGPPPPLYLIVVIRSCSMFGRVGQILTLMMSTVLLVLQSLIQSPTPTQLGTFLQTERLETVISSLRINITLAFTFGAVFILLFINALISEQQSRRKLAYANAQLRQYALRIEDQATLQERNRIAREMHDAVGHSLTAQSIQLDTVLFFLQSNPERAHQSLVEAKRLGTQALKEVRTSIGSLRAEPLQGQSLENAIAKLAQDFQQTTGVLPTWNARIKVALPSEISLSLYRVVQEALTNIAKHSEATEVNIYLHLHTGNLNLLIQDNGKGFDPTQNTTGFGLQGMQERIMALNGVFSLVSQPGVGCKVMVQLPVPDLK